MGMGEIIMNPVCSVCIANYNGMGFIEACLKSVMAQDCGFEVEIIVHDDASTDDSVKFIRQHFPQVKLIESRENVGFCISNNRMAAQANGEYILLLNNDAELFPDALRRFYDHARNQERPGILGLAQYHAASGDLIDRGSIFDPFLNAMPNLNKARHDVGMVIGACLWLPKSLWDELGGFPEFFHTLAEDMHLCCMARLKGYPVEILEDSGFKHWVGASLGGGKVVRQRLSTSVKRRAWSERNKSFVMAITYPDPAFQIIFPLHLFLLLLEGAALSLIKRDANLFKTIYLSAIREIWRHRKTLFSLRQKIQACRRISFKQFFSVFGMIPYKLKMLIRHGMPSIR
jgi:GT2 family glycosyltransferase